MSGCSGGKMSMIIKLVKAHLKDTFSYKKIGLFYLSLFVFLIIRLYMFIDYLMIIDQTANLFDWVLYSIGGPVGNTRLLNGFFFLILLFMIIEFCRSIYEKNTFIYYILLTKSNSRLNWIISIFITQFISSIISVLITIKLTFILGIIFFETEGVSFYFDEDIALSLTDNLFIFVSIICGVWVINGLLSVQSLFFETDLSNQAISTIIIIILLLLHIYFPVLDNFNPIAYASLSSFIPYHSHLELTVIFRSGIALLINLILHILSLNSSQ